MKKALILGVVGAVALIAGWFYFGFVRSRPSTQSNEVIYEVTPGKTFRRVVHELVERGLITDSYKFLIYARLRGDSSRMRMGEYALRTDMLPGEVLDTITSGHSIEHLVTVAEGLNIYEIANYLDSKGWVSGKQFLQLCRDPRLIKALLGDTLPSLEGYLFPETYSITKFTGAEGLIRMMVNRFLAVYTPLSTMNTTALSRHQLVTLASIIEKETGAPEERPMISSVFHNRMRLHMKLQTDPTVLYGIADQTGVLRLNITRQDLLTPTRYNTYTLPGLPFGPIANPGREALRAAMKPASSNYLYFVSRNEGTHVFSATYEEHNAAVRKFQLDPKAREGKSWRDLKKNRQPGKEASGQE